MNPFAHMSPGLSLTRIGLALTLLATALLCPAAAADPNPQTAAPIKPPMKKILTPRNPKPTGWQAADHMAARCASCIPSMLPSWRRTAPSATT